MTDYDIKLSLTISVINKTGLKYNNFIPISHDNKYYSIKTLDR